MFPVLYLLHPHQALTARDVERLHSCLSLSEVVSVIGWQPTKATARVVTQETAYEWEVRYGSIYVVCDRDNRVTEVLSTGFSSAFEYYHYRLRRMLRI